MVNQKMILKFKKLLRHQTNMLLSMPLEFWFAMKTQISTTEKYGLGHFAVSFYERPNKALLVPG